MIDRFRGRLISAEHADYDIARAVWHGAIDRRPGLIARCIGTAEVIAAVRFAHDHIWRPPYVAGSQHGGCMTSFIHITLSV